MTGGINREGHEQDAGKRVGYYERRGGDDLGRIFIVSRSCVALKE